MVLGANSPGMKGPGGKRGGYEWSFGRTVRILKVRGANWAGTNDSGANDPGMKGPETNGPVEKIGGGGGRTVRV